MLAVKDVALFVAAPFIGLVYAVTLPVVGTALIARAAYKAYRA
jgi:multisubunit Na+/H+ antiporter MnhG subunit